MNALDKNKDDVVTMEEFESVGLAALPNFDNMGAEGHHYDVESGASPLDSPAKSDLSDFVRTVCQSSSSTTKVRIILDAAPLIRAVTFSLSSLTLSTIISQRNITQRPKPKPTKPTTTLKTSSISPRTKRSKSKKQSVKPNSKASQSRRP